MGQELLCHMRYKQRMLAGKAYLETDYVLFRGEERLKILLKDLTSVKASGGVLTLDFEGGPAELELGQAAVKWKEKILHPPSRLDKLGVKPGLSVRLAGDFAEDFLDELARVAPASSRPTGHNKRWSLPLDGSKSDLVFFAADQKLDLGKVRGLAAGMNPDGAIWVVYPKGVAAIREIEVLEAGRKAGLKDVKVARFSATHTALKFVFGKSDRRSAVS